MSDKPSKAQRRQWQDEGYAACKDGQPIPPEIATASLTSMAAHHWLIGWWKRHYAEAGYPVWNSELA